MKTLFTKGLVTAGVLASIAAILTLFAILIPKLQVSPDGQALGSITQGNEYFSTTTRSAVSGVELTNLKVLKIGPGSLGSVVITGAGTGIINLYDATSTVTNAEWATTSLAVFPASAAAGTYTFDAVFSKGLLFEEVGSVASSTITWR